MDNSPKTESINDLVTNIDRGNIVLPEFQRNFVWEIGKTLDLFDSLVKDIFVGSIIYGIPSFEITVREIDNRPRHGSGSRRKLNLKLFDKKTIVQKSQVDSLRLVLDGQQRVTSIYRALKGIDNVWFILKPDEMLPEENDFNQASLEDVLDSFDTRQHGERLSVRLSDAYEIREQNYMEAEVREKFFEKLELVQSKSEHEKQNLFRRYNLLVRKIQDLFRAEKLLSFYLLNTTSEKFALFFERSNSRGVQLSFIDILAAKLYHGFNLRDKIEEFEESNKPYVLDREMIVRSIAFVVNGGKQKIDRSYILSELNAEHFNEYWDELCGRYKSCLHFLYKNNFILSQSWIPYPNMLLPLMMFLRGVGDFSRMNEKQLRFIKFWYWTSIFAERYSGATNETTIQDARVLQNISQGKGVTDRAYFYKLRVQISDPEEIYSLTKQSSAVYKGILNLIHYNAEGLVDWGNSRKVGFNEEKLDSHHIFPSGYIKTAFVGDDEAQALTNSVANRTLIPKTENIRIGKQAPSEYLQQIAQSNPNIEANLRKHLIPVATFKGYLDNEYRDFLEERSNAIYDALKQHVVSARESIIEEFYQEPSAREDNEPIRVKASYYGKVTQALFYPDSEKIYYNGQWYSPSAAGSKFKKDATGQEQTTNGWDFWKFVDELGNEPSYGDKNQNKPACAMIEV